MSLTWFEQESPTSCVAACVRMVLSSFGKNLSEIEIREILGNPQLGISLTSANEKLLLAGFETEIDYDLSLDDLRDYTRKNIFPIVGIERHILGYLPASHAVIVSKITGNSVNIFDPLETEHPKAFGKQGFFSAWKLSGKEALIIHR
jgi:ABC-type bacteriocin/lantibiotic exporter with double-glycine peptidase domain